MIGVLELVLPRGTFLATSHADAGARAARYLESLEDMIYNLVRRIDVERIGWPRIRRFPFASFAFAGSDARRCRVSAVVPGVLGAEREMSEYAQADGESIVRNEVRSPTRPARPGRAGPGTARPCGPNRSGSATAVQRKTPAAPPPRRLPCETRPPG